MSPDTALFSNMFFLEFNLNWKFLPTPLLVSRLLGPFNDTGFPERGFPNDLEF